MPSTSGRRYPGSARSRPSGHARFVASPAAYTNVSSVALASASAVAQRQLSTVGLGRPFIRVPSIGVDLDLLRPPELSHKFVLGSAGGRVSGPSHHAVATTVAYPPDEIYDDIARATRFCKGFKLGGQALVAEKVFEERNPGRGPRVGDAHGPSVANRRAALHRLR